MTFCSACASSVHAKGKRTTHKLLPLSYCDDCEVELVTLSCEECGMKFCSACAVSAHAKGKRKDHTLTDYVSS